MAPRDHVAEWLNAAMALIYPCVCQICGARRAEVAEGFVCRECQLRARFVVPPFCGRCGLPFAGEFTTSFECANCRDLELHFTSARSAVIAEGLVLEVIHRFKYQRQLWFEPFLGGLLARQAAPVLAAEGWDLLVPVPLHPVKFREREFNQAERLARRLAGASGVALEPRALRRVRPTRTQTLLSREERAANVRHAFRPNARVGLRGRRVVLVDDVFTTGATTSACARALREAGAAAVCVWTVARGM
jgi:ComF family protein